jgi:hypothetical protein
MDGKQPGYSDFQHAGNPRPENKNKIFRKYGNQSIGTARRHIHPQKRRKRKNDNKELRIMSYEWADEHDEDLSLRA